MVTRQNNGILHRSDWTLAQFSLNPVQLMGSTSVIYLDCGIGPSSLKFMIGKGS